MSLLIGRLSPPGGNRKPPTLSLPWWRGRWESAAIETPRCFHVDVWILSRGDDTRRNTWRRVAEVSFPSLQVNNSDDLSSVNCPLPRAACIMWGWKTSERLKSLSEGLEYWPLIFKRVRNPNLEDDGQKWTGFVPDLPATCFWCLCNSFIFDSRREFLCLVLIPYSYADVCCLAKRAVFK